MTLKALMAGIQQALTNSRNIAAKDAKIILNRLNYFSLL